LIKFAVSTAPKHFNQPDPNAKISKTKRKKIKKKAKVKQALLEKQIKDLEELEERETRMALAACTLTDGPSLPDQGTFKALILLIICLFL
jgi:serine/threonine-protein kinase SRPK1